MSLTILPLASQLESLSGKSFAHTCTTWGKRLLGSKRERGCERIEWQQHPEPGVRERRSETGSREERLATRSFAFLIPNDPGTRRFASSLTSPTTRPDSEPLSCKIFQQPVDTHRHAACCSGLHSFFPLAGCSFRVNGKPLTLCVAGSKKFPMLKYSLKGEEKRKEGERGSKEPEINC